MTTMKINGAEYEIGAGADLRGANLEGADLYRADLWGADLEGANLRGADLRGAYLYRADLRGADLRGAYLYRADLRGADLRGANLRGVNLEGANLRGADLRGADLRGADLYRADLRGADLEPIKQDMFAVLNTAPAEVAGLRKALVEGRVDGSTYHGSCACLVGTLANVAHVAYTAIPGLAPDADRPIERFFLGISQGQTPETNQFAALAVAWIDEWYAQMGRVALALGYVLAAPVRADGADSNTEVL